MLNIVAIIKGTRSEEVIDKILKINRKSRQKVKEITLDMTGSMKLIAKRCFPNAIQVVDRFHVQKLKQYYPKHLRLVKYWDEEQNREFIFLTNVIKISALQVAELYRNRWQVELFFKWLKQHLRIKKF